MYLIFILGTAGSGKSLLTKVLGDWLEDHELSAARINLDPAAEWLPYSPEIDARDYVNARKLMEEMGLGPNGSLIAAVDMLVSHVNEIKESMENLDVNYVLIDTPGQMEIFAFRKGGPLIVEMLSEGHKAASVYLIDSYYMREPPSFVSALLLSVSTQLRIGLPQVNVINKVDLLSDEELEKLKEWISDLTALMPELSQSDKVGISLELLEALNQVPALGETVLASVITEKGIDEIYAALQRVFAGGEDYVTEEASPRM